MEKIPLLSTCTAAQVRLPIGEAVLVSYHRLLWRATLPLDMDIENLSGLISLCLCAAGLWVAVIGLRIYKVLT